MVDNMVESLKENIAELTKKRDDALFAATQIQNRTNRGKEDISRAIMESEIHLQNAKKFNSQISALTNELNSVIQEEMNRIKKISMN